MKRDLITKKNRYLMLNEKKSDRISIICKLAEIVHRCIDILWQTHAPNLLAIEAFHLDIYVKLIDFSLPIITMFDIWDFLEASARL